MNFNIPYIVFALLLIFSISSCEKMLEIEPPKESISAQNIYENNTTAASVLTGIYTEWGMFGLFSGRESIGLRTGLTGDELVSTASEIDILTILYKNNITNEGGQLFWPNLYTYIYKANSAIEGLLAAKSISDNVRKQLIGEAKFVRALLYFHLVNLYGDVPLLLTTDLNKNIRADRASTAEVYQQIETDLADAVEKLSENYLASNVTSNTDERVRPNKYVALSLLARVYLYTHQWQKAEETSSQVISNSQYQLEPAASVFASTSKEAIFQVQPTIPGTNTLDAPIYILYAGSQFSSPGPNGEGRPVYLSPSLYESFESNDSRKN